MKSPRLSQLLHSHTALPVAVFVLVLALSIVVSLRRHHESVRLAEVNFVRSVDRVSSDVQGRFTRLVTALEGTRGLYAASESVGRTAFRNYVESRDLPHKFPGVRGFGFIQRVTRAGLGAFIVRAQSDGAPDFVVSQLSDRSHDDLYVVKFAEPAANNAAALGLDVGSEPTRRSALQRSIDTGEPALTAAITLVQDQRQTAGLLLFLPVYARGANPTTVEERRAALVGVLSCQIVLAEFLVDLEEVMSRLVDFELFDASPGADSAVMVFDADGHVGTQVNAGNVSVGRFSVTRPLPLPGRDFSVQVHSMPLFDEQIDRITPWRVFLAGLTLSSLLALLLRQQATGRLRAESLARQMTEDLRLMAEVVQLTGNSVMMTDAGMRVTWVNDGFTQISGYSRDDAIGRTPGQLLLCGNADPAALKVLNDAVAAGTRCQVEILNRAKDGREYWISTEIQPRHDAQGVLVGFVEVGVDITASKKAEVELQQNRDRLAELVKAKTADLERALLELRQQRFVIDQHAIVTVCGVDGRITYGNDKFSQLSGYPQQEFIGCDHALLNSGYHPKGFFKTMYQTIARGDVWHGEICNRAKDGSLYWVDSTTAAFMDESGKPREYISVRTDITQRKRAESNAYAASRAKSDFLANMSHELRTPMNGVVGMVDILQQTELLPNQHRMVSTIHSSALSLLQLLNDILDFSKIEAGKLEVESIPTHLREVVESAAQLLAVVSDAKSVDLSVFVSPDLPTWIVSDPVRLRQVLLNLMGNAIKFGRNESGQVARVNVQVVRCVLADGLDGVRLSVSDNGIGMSPAVVAKLFQPFTQADESTARKFGGTGLGLSITQRLVELLHGGIAVQSVLGEGSEFSVTLPLQAADASREMPHEPRLDGLHVLVVTRDPRALAVQPTYFRAAGAQVTAVPDLAGARQEIGASEYASSSWVVVLSLDIATRNAELGLPAGVGVVRLVRHGGADADGADADGAVVTVPALPLIYRELISAVARASGGLCTSDKAEPVVQRRQQVRYVPEPALAHALDARPLVLLAEDNETNRDVIQEQLHLLGCACEVAEDGALALKMWQDNPNRYALLLTDCHMPNLDGFGLTAAIRHAEHLDAHLPIIAITANAMQGEAQRCRDHGMDDYLSKPLRMTELSAMLRKWLPVAAPLE